MITKFILPLALALAICSPALAQSNITLSKGQVLRIAPDGKVSVVQMSMQGKMQEEMKKQAQPVTKGLVVWFDQNGQLSYLTNPVDPSWVTGAPMNKMKK